MTLDLRMNPASFRRHINTSTDVRTGRQVDVGYWLYDIVTKIQPISDIKLTSDACWGRCFSYMSTELAALKLTLFITHIMYYHMTSLFSSG